MSGDDAEGPPRSPGSAPDGEAGTAPVSSGPPPSPGSEGDGASSAPDRTAAGWGSPGVRRAAGVAVLLAALALPLLLNDFRLSLVAEILAFGLLAASLDLLVGYTGLPSLGHALAFGVGGYAAALTALHVSPNGPLGLLVGALAATAVSLPTGWLAVRTRGVYFLMLTLAFAQLAASLAITWTPVTGGANGLRGMPPVGLLPGDEGALLSAPWAFHLYTLAAFALGFGVLRGVVRSPFGRALVGIRENEARMRAVGHATDRYKLGAFTLAGAVGGYAGALFAEHSRFVSPANTAFEISALALVMVIIGGTGTLAGPVLGAAVVLLLRDELSSRFAQWQLVLGVVFVLVVYFLPGGVAALRTRLLARRAPTAGEAA